MNHIWEATSWYLTFSPLYYNYFLAMNTTTDKHREAILQINSFASRSDEEKLAIISHHSSQKLNSIISNLAPLPAEESSASSPHSTTINNAIDFLLHWDPVTLMQPCQISTEFLPPQLLTTDSIPEVKVPIRSEIRNYQKINNLQKLDLWRRKTALERNCKRF